MTHRWQTILPYHKIPDVPACYVVLDGKNALYVGQTTNLARRMKSHAFVMRPDHLKTKWGKLRYGAIKFKTYARYGEWLMAEARLIRRLKPKYNKTTSQHIVATPAASEQLPTFAAYLKGVMGIDESCLWTSPGCDLEKRR